MRARPEPPRSRRHLTPQQKAEAAGLWRTGAVTLEDLSRRYGKRPETFSRLFKEMGAIKGEASAEHEQKVRRQVEQEALADATQVAARIVETKEEQYKMMRGLAKLLWSEIVTARQSKRPLEELEKTIKTLNLAATTLSTIRRDMYTILRIDEHDAEKDPDELPDLKIQELSAGQIQNMRDAGGAELGLGEDSATVDVPSVGELDAGVD